MKKACYRRARFPAQSEPCRRIQRCLERSPSRANSKDKQNPEQTPIKARKTHDQPAVCEDFMAFRPNYNRDRQERDRAARARSDEKKRKKDEKTAQRKAERAADEVPPAEEQG